jgi:hypothetical protein
MNTKTLAPELERHPDPEAGVPTGTRDVQARMTWREDRGRLRADWRFGRPMTPAGELWRRPAPGAV